MHVIKCIALIWIILLLLTPAGYCQSSRIVAIFNEDSSIVELGNTEQVDLLVKNAGNTNATFDLYIGSTDPGFRFWIWFENNRYGSTRVQKKITLGAHEQRNLIVNVFGGKVGNYDLIVGPDGSDITNRYDSIDIKVIKRSGKMLFSDSPGLGGLGIFLALVVAAIILLSRRHK